MSGTYDHHEMVMRSVYLPVAMDTELRELAHRTGQTKSALIRAAISGRLLEWRDPDNAASLEEDLQGAVKPD